MDENFVLIPAKSQGQWGYLNVNGEWAISPRFDAAWDFEVCGVEELLSIIKSE